MLQGFRRGGLHRSWFNERKAFISWCNMRQFLAKVSGYINVVKEGCLKGIETHIRRCIDVHAGMQRQVSFLTYKQALFYTHAHTTHTIHMVSHRM